MKYKIAILIVLYNSSIKECKTIQSLKTFINDENIKIIIWNNGPKDITAEYGLELINTLENRSLARIYNSFIDMVDADNYLILDHDTSLNNDYITDIKNENHIGITVPRVYDDNILYYPFYESGIYPFAKKKKPTDNKVLYKYRFFMSIASGLNISRDVVTLMQQKYGSVFDERYKLYGIDTAFFIRASKLKLPCYINGRIDHSLSRLSAQNDPSYSFREKERAIDNILTLINYPSLRTTIRAMKFFVKNKRIARYYKFILFCFKLKKHPENM